MQIRNPKFARFGLIDCDIEHPFYGWVPFTAGVGTDIFKAALDMGPAPFVDPNPPPPKLQCTPSQMRLTLHRAGLLATVQAIADSDPEASIVWEYATVIVRDSPFIAALSAASGFTGAQIDALFIEAMAV